LVRLRLPMLTPDLLFLPLCKRALYQYHNLHHQQLVLLLN
jgi:hypothetical protein